VTLRVQRKLCATCIYRDGFGWNIEHLESQVRCKRTLGTIAFDGYRVCHHSEDACCRGFWNLHKDAFTLGQIAQRLDLVEFVDDDV
jgi:hypothetical protein